MRRRARIGVLVLFALAGATLLLLKTDLIPEYGRWYSPNSFHRAQSLALLRGELPISRNPANTLFDTVWSSTGIQSNFGLGVAIVAAPFDAVARAIGAYAFPDRVRFLLLFAVALFVLAWGLDSARQRSSPDTGVLAALASAGVLAFTPALYKLINSRFVVYEETISYAVTWTFLLLGLLLRYTATSGRRALYALSLTAALGCMFRPTSLLFGGAALGIALLHGWRVNARRRDLVCAAVLGLLGPVSLGVTNYLRFGGPFRFGTGALLSVEYAQYLTRWDVPFTSIPWWRAAREMTGFLFFLDAAPAANAYDMAPYQGWLAPVGRWREFYFQPFDAFTLGLLVASLLVFVASAKRARQTDSPPWTQLPSIVLGVWGGTCFAGLFLFYSRLPYLVSRYAVEFAVPISALLLAGFFIAVERVTSPSRRSAIAIASLVVWTAWCYSRDYTRTNSSEYTAEVLDAKEMQGQTEWFVRPGTTTVPDSYACDGVAQTPGWNLDCTIGYTARWLTNDSPCIVVTVAPTNQAAADEMNAAWNSAAEHSFEWLAAAQDQLHLLRCAAPGALVPQEGSQREVTFCQPTPMDPAFQGLRQTILAVAPPNQDPEPGHIRVMSLRTAGKADCTPKSLR